MYLFLNAVKMQKTVIQNGNLFRFKYKSDSPFSFSGQYYKPFFFVS
jgi:hypothetical protein